MWVIKRNLPNTEEFTRPSFYAAMVVARKLLDGGAYEVVIEGPNDVYVIRKLLS